MKVILKATNNPKDHNFYYIYVYTWYAVNPSSSYKEYNYFHYYYLNHYCETTTWSAPTLTQMTNTYLGSSVY